MTPVDMLKITEAFGAPRPYVERGQHKAPSGFRLLEPLPGSRQSRDSPLASAVPSAVAPTLELKRYIKAVQTLNVSLTCSVNP